MKGLKRNCDYCGKEYLADIRNLKRGWGLCCSKSCAAKKREVTKPGYDRERVEANNIRRKYWNHHDGRTFHAKKIEGYTPEGYAIIGGTAYDEFGQPVYDIDREAGFFDGGDNEYWDTKDF